MKILLTLWVKIESLGTVGTVELVWVSVHAGSTQDLGLGLWGIQTPGPRRFTVLSLSIVLPEILPVHAQGA